MIMASSMSYPVKEMTHTTALHPWGCESILNTQIQIDNVSVIMVHMCMCMDHVNAYVCVCSLNPCVRTIMTYLYALCVSVCTRGACVCRMR